MLTVKSEASSEKESTSRIVEARATLSGACAKDIPKRVARLQLLHRIRVSVRHAQLRHGGLVALEDVGKDGGHRHDPRVAGRDHRRPRDLGCRGHHRAPRRHKAPGQRVRPNLLRPRESSPDAVTSVFPFAAGEFVEGGSECEARLSRWPGAQTKPARGFQRSPCSEGGTACVSRSISLKSHKRWYRKAVATHMGTDEPSPRLECIFFKISNLDTTRRRPSRPNPEVPDCFSDNPLASCLQRRPIIVLSVVSERNCIIKRGEILARRCGRNWQLRSARRAPAQPSSCCTAIPWTGRCGRRRPGSSTSSAAS